MSAPGQEHPPRSAWRGWLGLRTLFIVLAVCWPWIPLLTIWRFPDASFSANFFQPLLFFRHELGSPLMEVLAFIYPALPSALVLWFALSRRFRGRRTALWGIAAIMLGCSLMWVHPVGLPATVNGAANTLLQRGISEDSHDYILRNPPHSVVAGAHFD